MSTLTLTSEKTLGPLTHEQRVLIMQHARDLSRPARQMFRRLLILAQQRELSSGLIERAATQAREHDRIFS
jgi:hypothetical protein